MSGFGSGPYGAGPYGVPGLPPEPETVAALSSSRKIDFITRRYVTAADGGFEPMDDVAQRVQLLVSFAVRPQKIITPQDNADTAARIRVALEPLTKGAQPTIRIVELAVEDRGGGKTLKFISYQNLLTGTQQTLYGDGTLVIR